eukprot:CAMPEP_0185162886 /NCGR_PEP_ID=MMETSP1139-20130426/7157_1 /TAXON_ID=298111 /ORGANISM="Pavlova sp., Strain CCMP459" /LENGTH=62 /DNA_ID=CAMNT_0027728227 /DNA_START=44 /DNA_END=232 /DNA_ORIENTATION=+
MPNMVKEKQAAWQALKKATGGNTCWTGNATASVALSSIALTSGLLVFVKGLTDLSLGLNKFR